MERIFFFFFLVAALRAAPIAQANVRLAAPSYANIRSPSSTAPYEQVFGAQLLSKQMFGGEELAIISSPPAP